MRRGYAGVSRVGGTEARAPRREHLNGSATGHQGERTRQAARVWQQATAGPRGDQARRPRCPSSPGASCPGMLREVVARPLPEGGPLREPRTSSRGIAPAADDEVGGPGPPGGLPMGSNIGQSSSGRPGNGWAARSASCAGAGRGRSPLHGHRMLAVRGRILERGPKNWLGGRGSRVSRTRLCSRGPREAPALDAGLQDGNQTVIILSRPPGAGRRPGPAATPWCDHGVRPREGGAEEGGGGPDVDALDWGWREPRARSAAPLCRRAGRW